MAVLIQPALDTEFGGTARIRGEIVEIVAVRGSPGPLVQGWEPGVAGTVDGDDIITGTALTELLGECRVIEITNTMHRAQISTGATSCEWGWVDGALTLFQLAKPPAPAPTEDAVVPEGLRTDLALQIAHVARRYPGPFGEQFVLPWALSGGFTPVPLEPRGPAADIGEALASAQAIAATLTSQAWGRPKSAAMPMAIRTLRELRGTEPDAALEAVAALGAPDWEQAGALFGLISEIAAWLVTAGVITSPDLVWHLEPETIMAAAKTEVPRLDRIGFDRWEPFTTAVVSANGVSSAGSSAAPGVASGRFCRVLDSEDLRNFRPRDVLVSTHPVPNLAPLLWDAAAVVTTGGSAAAHLFESARALAIPAVCGVRLEEIIGTDLTAREVGEYVIAVDGNNGTITGMEW
jgi:hypothetical protein